MLRALIAAGIGCTFSTPVLSACDPVWLPNARTRGLTYFVAVALADTVLDAGIVDERSRSRYPFDLSRHMPGQTAGGQRAHLTLSGKSGTPSIRSSSEVVLVPWSYSSDCSPVPWLNGLRWMTPGLKGFFTAYLRPKERWIGGLPTFDVPMAWREPLWQMNDSRWPHDASRAELLSPDEFMQVYAALPDWERLRDHPRAAVASLKEWEAKHPELARREPARTILNNAYRSTLDSRKTVR